NGVERGRNVHRSHGQNERVGEFRPVAVRNDARDGGRAKLIRGRRDRDGSAVAAAAENNLAVGHHTLIGGAGHYHGGGRGRLHIAHGEGDRTERGVFVDHLIGQGLHGGKGVDPRGGVVRVVGEIQVNGGGTDNSAIGNGNAAGSCGRGNRHGRAGLR